MISPNDVSDFGYTVSRGTLQKSIYKDLKICYYKKRDNTLNGPRDDSAFKLLCANEIIYI